jgi:hypothetical protein
MGKKPASKHVTLGGDKGYDTQAFVAKMRRLHVTARGAEHDQS